MGDSHGPASRFVGADHQMAGARFEVSQFQALDRLRHSGRVGDERFDDQHAAAQMTGGANPDRRICCVAVGQH